LIPDECRTGRLDCTIYNSPDPTGDGHVVWSKKAQGFPSLDYEGFIEAVKKKPIFSQKELTSYDTFRDAVRDYLVFDTRNLDQNGKEKTSKIKWKPPPKSKFGE
jgi:hypothetical protein